MRWLLWLYPRAWRERYGAELLALLEDAGTTPRTVFDTALGALDAHLHPVAVLPAPAAQPSLTLAASRPPEPPEPPASEPRPRPGRPEVRPLAAAPWLEPPRESVIDQIIRAAQERGEFDGLPGEGKPLPLDDNPFAGEWGLAHHVVKQAGETLPWIALGREIEADEQTLRAQLAAAAEDLARRPAPGDVEGARGWAAAHRRARERYLADAAELDRKLASYNWQVTSQGLTWLDRGRLPPHIAQARFDAACPLDSYGN